MIKRMVAAVILILLGICSIIFPELLRYIEVDYINLFLIIHDYPIIRFFFGGSLIVVGIVLLVIKPAKVYCMKSNDIVDALPTLPIGFSCEKELDLKTTNISRETLKNAINDVRNFTRHINTSKVDKPCFFSICDIPLIVKAGYLIGDGTHSVRYLHYIRNKGKCVEIKGNDGDLKFSSNFVDKGSKQLLVTLSTSFTIKTDNLNKRFSDMNLLCIESNNVDVDSITKLNDLNRFCDFAVEKIREKSADTNSVHLLLATSSSVAFAIGQRISNTMDRPTIVYQFENSNVKDNRPWGILINSKDDQVDEIVFS